MIVKYVFRVAIHVVEVKDCHMSYDSKWDRQGHTLYDVVLLQRFLFFVSVEFH